MRSRTSNQRDNQSQDYGRSRNNPDYGYQRRNDWDQEQDYYADNESFNPEGNVYRERGYRVQNQYDENYGGGFQDNRRGGYRDSDRYDDNRDAQRYNQYEQRGRGYREDFEDRNQYVNDYQQNYQDNRNRNYGNNYDSSRNQNYGRSQEQHQRYGTGNQSRYDDYRHERGGMNQQQGGMNQQQGRYNNYQDEFGSHRNRQDDYGWQGQGYDNAGRSQRRGFGSGNSGNYSNNPRNESGRGRY